MSKRERLKDKERYLDRNQLVPAHLVHGMQHSEMRERERERERAHLTYLMFTIEPWKYTASLQHWPNSNDSGYVRS